MSASLVGSEMCIRDRPIMSLRCWICDVRWQSAFGVQTAQQSPPAYEPQSNGSVENAVRQLRG
eukprot:12320175-Alexandrium_andersonii.AAC.1